LTKNNRSARKARGYLYQALKLNKAINEDIAEMVRLRELATCIPSLTEAKASGSGTSDKIGSIAAMLADLDASIKSKTGSLLSLKHIIRERTEKITDDILRLVLQKRYLDFQEFEDIAYDLNYTFEGIMRLHAKALEELKKTKHLK